MLRNQECEDSPFVIGLLLDLCLELGSDLLQIHRWLGWLAVGRRHALPTASFRRGENNYRWKPEHRHGNGQFLMGETQRGRWAEVAGTHAGAASQHILET